MNKNKLRIKLSTKEQTGSPSNSTHPQTKAVRTFAEFLFYAMFQLLFVWNI